MSTWSSPIHLPVLAYDRARWRRRLDFKTVLGLTCLTAVLIAQGAAVTQSYLWAAPLLAILVVALATDIPIVPFLGLILLLRVLTDDQAPTNIRHSGSLDSSAFVALLFILIAIGLSIRRRQGIRAALLATLWLCVWTSVAVLTHGASTETIREGVREASVVALAVIVCNSAGVLSLSVVTRLIQVAGIASALIALYQLETHTGQLIVGQIRSNGTFAHPNDAAMYFSIAATASWWRYFDYERHRADLVFGITFSAATISTFSLGGLASLLVMLVALGALRPGAIQTKLAASAVAGVIAVAFLATPLGAERLASETSTEFSSAQTTDKPHSSLQWRFYKWGTLIPLWEQAPLLGQGLGTTTTIEGTAENTTTADIPHNEYVRYLVETGAVGLALLLWALVLLMRELTRRRRTEGIHGGAILALSVLAGCLVNALSGNTFLNSTTCYATALIIAAVLSLPPQSQSTGNHPRLSTTPKVQ